MTGTGGSWDVFAAAAPRIAAVFRRRHAATGNLCFLGTLRPDGFPRVSPMEPWFFEGTLWLGGMPGLFARTGFDLRGQTFEHLFATRVAGAAAVEIVDGHLDVTVWREGGAERVVRKH